jgi:AP-1 complex subunit gamma-1
VKEDVWHALIVVITNAPDLHGYTVRALYRALHTSFEQETLVRVAIWCIGEYADLLVNNAGMLDLEDPITVSTIILHSGFIVVTGTGGAIWGSLS